MDSIRVGIQISYGWCILTLSTEDDHVTVRTHWLQDGLTALTESVLFILRDGSCASVRWPLELAGGHFVDLVSDPHGGVNIAVSEFSHGVGASLPGEIWSASRGRQVFAARTGMSNFVEAYLNELRRVHVRYTDDSGLIEEWRHTFPRTLYENLESLATRRFGFKPLSVAELT